MRLGRPGFDLVTPRGTCPPVWYVLPSMSFGVKFYSYFDISGYGLAALAYLRGLLNAGVQVHWIPLVWSEQGYFALRPTDTPPLLEPARDDTSLQDLAAIRAATCRPIDYSSVLVQTVPELWSNFFEPGKKNVGYTTWEADALPPHWKPSLDLADLICVPSEMNGQVFRAAHLKPPVQVVPHIRRHVWNDFTASELQALRDSLSIPADHFIFYSINTWEPRKNNPQLLQSYLEAFSDDSPVTLILKTDEQGYGAAPFYPRQATTELASTAMANAKSNKDGAQAQVCLLPYKLSGRGIDMLHAIGDCYVSASRGEGWAMGAFDAATRGTPVIMTGWGGQTDYLGPDWPGAIPFNMHKVPVWPPSAPSFWPPQRWADPAPNALVAAFRNAVTDAPRQTDAAQTIASRIANRYAEPLVTAQLMALLHA